MTGVSHALIEWFAVVIRRLAGFAEPAVAMIRFKMFVLMVRVGLKINLLARNLLLRLFTHQLVVVKKHYTSRCDSVT